MKCKRLPLEGRLSVGVGGLGGGQTFSITQSALTYFAEWAAPAMHAAPTMRLSLELRHMPNASGSAGKENSY